MSGTYFILYFFPSLEKLVESFLFPEFLVYSMAPNVDLILLSLLHGSVISLVLLLVTFAVFMSLLLAFCIILLLIVFVDLYDVASYARWFLAVLRCDIELAALLTLRTLFRFVVYIASASKLFLDSVGKGLKLKLQLLRVQSGLL